MAILAMFWHFLLSTCKEFANNSNFNFKAKSCFFWTTCKCIRWTWMAMNLLRKYDSHVYLKAHIIRNCNTCKPNSLPFCVSSELERTLKCTERSGLANDFLSIYLYLVKVKTTVVSNNTVCSVYPEKTINLSQVTDKLDHIINNTPRYERGSNSQL